MNRLTDDEVKHVAMLARLKLKDELFEDKYVKYVTQNIIKVLKDN